MDIIRQQKEVNDQLAKIQAQVEALNPEEKEQLAELMKSSSLVSLNSFCLCLYYEVCTWALNCMRLMETWSMFLE